MFAVSCKHYGFNPHPTRTHVMMQYFYTNLNDLISHSCVSPLVSSQTKYRPDEILKWKKMCHPNLVPLLALQYSFCPVEPLEKGHVVAYCWAYMPVLDSECLESYVWMREGQGIP